MKPKQLILPVCILGLCSWISPAALQLNSNKKAAISVKETAVPMFSYFRTHRQGRDGVSCTWGVGSGSGANQFIVQRTYEYPDEYTIWENIYQCNGNARGTFSFCDENVYPGVISYRVVAVNGGTPLFVSEISAVQIRQR